MLVQYGRTKYTADLLNEVNDCDAKGIDITRVFSGLQVMEATVLAVVDGDS